MDGSNVRHYANVGMSDLSQRRDLTRVRHPEFDDRDLVLGLELQQLQRQSKVIVEVSFRLHDAKTPRENVRNGFFRGRLPRRTGDRDQRLAPAGTDRGSESLEGHECVVDDQQLACIRKAGYAFAIHDRSQSPILQSGFHIVVPIQAFALHREEELARLDGARVYGVALGNGVELEAPDCSGEFSDAMEFELHCARSIAFTKRCSRALRASATSSNGKTPSRVVCVFSCPLPAIGTMSPGLAASMAMAIARRRSASTA